MCLLSWSKCNVYVFSVGLRDLCHENPLTYADVNRMETLNITEIRTDIEFLFDKSFFKITIQSHKITVCTVVIQRVYLSGDSDGATLHSKYIKKYLCVSHRNCHSVF